MSDYVITYDLGKCPASWDFLNWLINCEAQRRLHNGGPLKIRFLPGPKGGFRDDNLARPLEQRRAIFDNVMRPALWLIGAEEVTPDTPETAQAPSYLPAHTVSIARQGVEIPKFTVPDDVLAEVDAYLGDRKPVVITLRECDYYPERNSRLANWVKLVENRKFDAIFVRDTAKADEPIEEHEICPRASRDLLFRAGLMQRARLNMMVANGPMAIAHHLSAPWVMFKPLVPELPAYSPGQPKFWDAMGIGVAGQWPWTRDDQRICWGDDTLQILETAWCGINGLPDPHPVKPLGQIITKGAWSDEQRYESTVINVKKVKSRLSEIPSHTGVAVLACYGPSLKDTWEATKHERAFIPGSQLITVSGAHDFLIGHGIVPDLHIDCDPRPHKHKMITKIHKRVHYLVASCVHPGYIDRLNARKANVSLWHLCNGDESMKILTELEPKSFLIGGGGSVGLRAICVMYALGFRRFIIHGMDCSFEESTSAQHAGPHTGKVQQALRVQAGRRLDGEDVPDPAGRWFNTSPVLVSYAQQFLDMLKLMMQHPDPRQRPSFEMHGDGLLQEMLKLSMKADIERKQKLAQEQAIHGGNGHGPVAGSAVGATHPAVLQAG